MVSQLEITDKTWVGDLESNGFLNEATVIWCGVFKNIITGEIRVFDINTDLEGELPKFLDGADTLIFHNGINFDRELLLKIINYNLDRSKIIDTLILSKLLNPDRKVPGGWTGLHKPHSIEAWGLRFGIPKPINEKWDNYTPHMLHRCKEDVEICERVFHYLIKEEMK